MKPINDQIYTLLSTKAAQNKDATDAAFKAFSNIKSILQEIEKTLKHKLIVVDARLKIQYTDRGVFEAELKIADDVLIFIMHTNAFVFDSNNPIWKTGYISADKTRGTCAMISIYNFLSDSFKFERSNETGQLIGRIFINREAHFFVEGKRNIGILFNDFSSQLISEEVLQSLIEEFIIYSMDIDVIVPSIDMMKEITVADALNHSTLGGSGGGKKLGFKFSNQSNDDIVT